MKRRNNILSDIFKNIQRRNPQFLLFPLTFIYFELLLRLFCGGKLFLNPAYPLLFGLSAGFLCTAVLSFFRGRTHRLLTSLLLFVSGLFFITECLVKNSFQLYMPPSSILKGAGGVVGGFRQELFRAVLYGIPVIILFLLPCILYILRTRRYSVRGRQRLSAIFMFVICSALCFFIGRTAAALGPVRDQYQAHFEFDNAVQTFGLITGLRLDAQYTLFENNPAETFLTGNNLPKESKNLKSASGTGDPAADKNSTPETDSQNNAALDLGQIPHPKPHTEYGRNEVDIPFDRLSSSDKTIAGLHSYVRSLKPSGQNVYTGLFKGKNLILICAEAFSDTVIDKEMTPTLYRMAHNGFYFSDYYQPSWGGSTSTGEYSFLTGFAPVNGVKAMLQTENKNMYYTMGNQLQRLGYFSRCYHNGNYDYYSRNKTHENLGYEQFLGLGNGLEKITGGWPRDEVMFDRTMDTYIDKQPFSIYYMTISGHCVYTKNSSLTKRYLDSVRKVKGHRYKNTTTYYLAYQMELEKALTTMIRKLEEAGIADDTVICLTSDHYPYGLEKSSTFGNSEDYLTDLYGGKYKTSWEKDHNSLIIWSGSLEHDDKEMACEVSTPTYSLDIVPTLSNLFGLEYDSRLLVGRDVFSDAEPLVLWNNYSWVTTEGRYNSATGKFTPNKNSKADKEYVRRIKSVVADKLTYSRHVVAKNYFQILFGNSKKPRRNS